MPCVQDSVASYSGDGTHGQGRWPCVQRSVVSYSGDGTLGQGRWPCVQCSVASYSGVGTLDQGRWPCVQRSIASYSGDGHLVRDGGPVFNAVLRVTVVMEHLAQSQPDEISEASGDNDPEVKRVQQPIEMIPCSAVDGLAASKELGTVIYMLGPAFVGVSSELAIKRYSSRQRSKSTVQKSHLN